jgi:hypothetical protein
MKTAADLRSQKDLRYQAIFSIGAAGSGKSFVLNKWLKWAPGADNQPKKMTTEVQRALEEGADLSKFSPETQAEVQRLRGLKPSQFGLSPLDLKKIKTQLQGAGISIQTDDSGNLQCLLGWWTRSRKKKSPRGNGKTTRLLRPCTIS